MNPQALRARAEALRITTRELAEKAGVDEDGAGRIFKGQQDPRLSTMRKLDTALHDEEVKLAGHLAELGVEVKP